MKSFRVEQRPPVSSQLQEAHRKQPAGINPVPPVTKASETENSATPLICFPRKTMNMLDLPTLIFLSLQLPPKAPGKTEM